MTSTSSHAPQIFPPQATPRPDQRDIQFTRDPQTGGYQLICAQFVPYPREVVFQFFADAFGLEALTPPWLNFHVLTPRPIEMSAGLYIDYRLKLRGIPLRWRSRIDVWEPPYRFVDVQVRGPYKIWHHEHVFDEVEGGTWCRDLVHYSVPGGWLIDNLLVRPDLQKIFSYRQAKLCELLPPAPAP